MAGPHGSRVLFAKNPPPRGEYVDQELLSFGSPALVGDGPGEFMACHESVGVLIAQGMVAGIEDLTVGCLGFAPNPSHAASQASS